MMDFALISNVRRYAPKASVRFVFRANGLVVAHGAMDLLALLHRGLPFFEIGVAQQVTIRVRHD